MRVPAIILAILAGLVSATGFAPIGAWPLTLAAFAALLFLIERASNLRAALAIGWGFGLGQFVLGLNWIATAFTFQAKMPAWLGVIAVVLLSIYLAVYPALAAGLTWRWGRASRPTAALVLAAAWIVTEWLRATLFTGFAWNPVGVVMVDLTVAQGAAFIGTYALSGLVVLLGGALLGIVALPGWRKAIAIPFLLLVAVDVLPPSPSAAGPLIHVVQPNIPQDEKNIPSLEDAQRGRYEALSGQPGPTPRLLLWPEAAVPDRIFLDEDPVTRSELATLLGPNDVLLAGGTALEYNLVTGRVAGARNSLFAMDAQARLVARYDKAHLVPYGEYLPMRPVLSAIGLSRLVPGDLDFWPGPGPRTVDLPGFGKVGIQICYEIVFSGDVVDASDRPGFIFNPSNDAWFGAFGPPQHLAQARLRAIEEGLSVVRATPTGISALIDPRGRLVQVVPSHVPGVIQARVPAALAPTPFSHAGDIHAFVVALIFAGLAVVTRRRAR